MKQEHPTPKHVYGVIQTDEETDWGSVGLGGSPVHTVTHMGLACVVSDYPWEGFANLPRAALVRHLLTHQAVLERVMNEHTVLPMKFGTLLASEGEVKALLAQGRTKLADVLDYLRGKIQVELVASWDANRVLKEIANEPEISRIREAVMQLPAERAEELRLRAGRIVKEALDHRRDSYCQRVLARLRPLAIDVQPNALLSDQIVMNVAFLIDESKEKEFDQQIREMNVLFCDQIDFRIIGPLPPYSFFCVEVSRPNWTEIDEARRMLSLGEVVSETMIRNAYRNLAATVHPDSNPTSEEAQDRFAGLRSASTSLLAYCAGVGNHSNPEDTYLVTRDAVERAFLIIIKSSENNEVESFRFGGLGQETQTERAVG